MISDCACGKPSQSTAGPSYTNTYWLNNKIVYAECEHGHVVVDNRNTIGGSIRFDECSTPIYTITKS